jgi:hypothetical protein
MSIASLGDRERMGMAEDLDRYRIDVRDLEVCNHFVFRVSN